MTTSNSANTKQSNNASQKRKPIHNGYFNHLTSSSSNIPMSILIREQGLEIYGLYWVMLEEAHAQLKCCVNIQTMGIIANIFHAQPEHLELLYHHYFRRPGIQLAYTLCRLLRRICHQKLFPAPPTGIHRQRTAADDYARRTESLRTILACDGKALSTATTFSGTANCFLHPEPL